MHDWLHDINWAVALRSEFLTPVFKGFSALGYGGFLILFLPFGYWVLNKQIFARVGLWLILSVLLNAWLKDFFQDPRPDIRLALDGQVGQSFGFPSGHAQMAVVVWLGIAWQARKTWIWITCSIVVAGICMSRLYLGVHDLADVLGGLLIGATSLAVFVFFSMTRHNPFRGHHFAWQLTTLVAVEALLFVTWPGGLSHKFAGYGVFLLAFWLGIGLERKGLDFQIHSRLGHRWAAAILGVMLLLLIKKGFGLLPAAGPTFDIPLNIFQAVINGLFMAFWAPWLFFKLGLARALHPQEVYGNNDP